MPASTRTINRQRFTAFFFLIIFFLIAFPFTAAAGGWQPLVSQAGARLASGNSQAGRITMVQGDTVIMEIVVPQVTVGSVVAVKNNALPGVPLPLQDNAALIRITQRLGSQARGTIIDGSGTILQGAALFPYSYNRIYVYTNLVNPERQLPFRDLVTELQRAQIPYAVKSLQELRYGAETGIRPLLIRLEGQGRQVIGRLTDFSEGTVLFSTAYTLPYPLAVAAPFGLPLQGGLAAGNQGGTKAGRSTSFTRAARVSGTDMTGRIKLKSSYNRLVFADLDGNGQDELVLLDKHWVEAFQVAGQQLKPFARYRLPRNDFLPLNLHFGDFNHNGKDELYVTLGLKVTVDEKPDTTLSSLVLEMSANRKFMVLAKDYPWYFRVMETRKGKRVLLAQEMDDYKQYKLPIRWAGFFDGKLRIRGEYREGRNVFSLDNFVLDPFNNHQIIVLDMQGGLGGFNSTTQELRVSSEEDYGMYDEIVYPQKLQEIEYEGGYIIKKAAENRFAPRRFTLKNSFGRQAFLIKKERRINPELLEKGIALLKDKTSKHDQVVGIQWKNSSIVETWKSPPIPRDIIDFGFTRLKGKNVMVIMTRSNTGKYALEMVK